jgi:CRISP-associated protein Cas1
VAILPHLIADQFGSHIGKYSERLKVTQKGETLVQAPLLHLESVHVLNRGVSISADALEACCERGIPVYFLDSLGTPYASIYSAGLTGTVITRREQLRAYDDWRGLHLGRRIAEGKIQNQAITLKYLSKTRKETPMGEELRLAAGDVLDHLRRLEGLEKRTLEAARNSMMAVEGNASQVYWAAVRLVVPDDYGWTRREGRGATDTVNSLLNYGYGILYGQIERALVLAGLDPFAGFIHADRPGKPSLTLDFIEEFRQTVVDRVVLGLLTRNFKVVQNEKGQLSEETRHTFAHHVIEHLASGVRYEGERHPLGQVIQMQARRMTGFLRQERDDYVPYKAEW